MTEENLYNAEQDLKGLNQQAENLGRKYDEMNKRLKEQEAIIARIKATPRDMTTIEGRLASNSLDTQYNRALDSRDAAQRNLWKITEEINKQNDLVVKQEEVVAKINAKYEKQKNDLAYINQQISNTELAQEQVNSTVEKTTTAHNKTLKSLTKIGLAVFGIRSAYMFVRQAMSHVLAGNEKLSNQMEGIKNSFYNAFTPIIEKIISGIKTLMAYINYLWKALFGKVLFAEKGTTNMSKNLASGAKSAKEINKQLASFDEANVLSSSKDTSGGGIGGGSSGNYDLGLSKIPIPGWLKWIGDFIEKHPKISKIIFGLAAFTLFGGWKLAGGIMGTIGSLLGGGAGAGATGLIGVLGTLALIAGTVWVVKVTYDKVKEGIKVYNEMKEAQKEAQEVTKSGIKLDGEKERSFLKAIKSMEKEDEQRMKNIDKVKQMMEIDAKYTYNVLEGRNTQSAAEEEYRKQLGYTSYEFNELYKSSELTNDEQYEYYKFLKVYLIPELIENAEQLGLTKDEADDLRFSFMKLDKKFKTQSDVDTKPARDAFEKFINQTNETLKKPIQMKLTASIDLIMDKVKKIVGNAFHSEGGIVNLPGRGVPITHYAGEAGREGIVPIDNEGQMALLGSEIAKRVTINLTNVTEMNGRTISKELKRISNESDFAFNR